MSRFTLAPEAAMDIEEIVKYIAKDNVGASLEIRSRFVENFRMLAKFPKSGRSRGDLAGSRPLLFWPAGNYLILYRPVTGGVEIVAVLHASRDIPMILRHRHPTR